MHTFSVSMDGKQRDLKTGEELTKLRSLAALVKRGKPYRAHSFVIPRLDKKGKPRGC
jgi:hypothetical protein